MIDKLNELCMWLSHQKGMMSKDYAKDLAKIIVELRQQADRIAELEKVLEHEGISVGRDLLNGGVALSKKLPQTKPLSDEEIENIAGNCCHGATAWHSPELDIYEFARAIEERHGIK